MKKSWGDMCEEDEGKTPTTPTFGENIGENMNPTIIEQQTGELEQQQVQEQQVELNSTTTTTTSTTNQEKKFSFGNNFKDFGENEVESVSDQQKDESNPLYSKYNSFEDFGLKKSILQGCFSLKFEHPSNIQGKTLPFIINEKQSLIAQSQSGTGKTACFTIGMLQHIDTSKSTPQAICISPTFELAEQIFRVTQDLAQHDEDLKNSIGLAVKGVNSKKKLKSPIIIGTPGKIFDMITKRTINPKFIKLLVLDEADQLLDTSMNSLREQCIKIKRKLPKFCRVLLFSATFTTENDDEIEEAEKKENIEKQQQIEKFALKMVPQPYKTILIPREKLTLKYMKQYFIILKTENEKYELLKEIYEELEVGQSIIFVNTKKTADDLKQRLMKENFKPEILHGGLDTNERRKVIRKFKNVESRVLLSTNVTSRGLDISSVTHVINYDLPIKPVGQGKKIIRYDPDPSTYLHRIGRTARFGRKGIAINFVQNQKDMDIINYFQKFFKITISKSSKDKIEDGEI